MPPDFRAVALPTPLLRARSILFGPAPDRRMLLYRTRQLLACLHAGPLEHAATDLDPRVTYLPLDQTSFSLPPATTIAPLAGSPAIALIGTPPAEAGGRTTFAWTVTLSGGSATSTTPSGSAATTTLDFSAGLAPVALPGSGLVLLVPSTAPSGSSWLVSAAVAPATGLPAVAANLANAGAATLAALFGQGVEPYQSWGNLWASRRPLPERLAALASALVYRTDAIRTGSP